HLACQRHSGVCCDSGVNVEFETLMNDAAGKVQFAYGTHVQFGKKFMYRERVIVGVAFQVVYIEDQAAAGPASQLVEKTGLGIIAGVIGEDVRDVLNQKGE